VNIIRLKLEHPDLMENALVYNSIIPKMEICQRNLVIVIQLDQGLQGAVYSIQSCQLVFSKQNSQHSVIFAKQEKTHLRAGQQSWQWMLP
jgi:hypothetical protein